MEKKRSVGVLRFGIVDIIIGLLGWSWFLLGFIAIQTIFGGHIDIIKTIVLAFSLGIGYLMQLVLGILIIKLKPLAMKLNLYLIPLIATINLMEVLVLTRFFTSQPFSPIKDLLAFIYFISLIIYYSSHFYFFTRPKVKEQFK